MRNFRKKGAILENKICGTLEHINTDTKSHAKRLEDGFLKRLREKKPKETRRRNRKIVFKGVFTNFRLLNITLVYCCLVYLLFIAFL